MVNLTKFVTPAKLRANAVYREHFAAGTYGRERAETHAKDIDRTEPTDQTDAAHIEPIE